MDAFILTQGENLTITYNGETITVNRNANPAFDEIVDAIENGDYERAMELGNPARALDRFYSDSGDTSIEVFGSIVKINGERVNEAMEARLLDMFANRLPLSPLANFMERINRNPSASARREAYLFLEGNNLPLTPDGCFMAYKSVNRWYKGCGFTHDEFGREFAEGDFMSIAKNSESGLPTRLRIGDELRMDRGKVDDRRENTCSFGFHFASLKYASTWTRHDALLLMKIDPADIVSIPNDYGNQKGRTCAYMVAGVHLENETATRFYGDNEVEEAFDSPVYDDGLTEDEEHRWLVYDEFYGAVIASFTTRSDAREFKRNQIKRGNDCFIVDNLNGCRVT